MIKYNFVPIVIILETYVCLKRRTKLGNINYLRKEEILKGNK